jgi:hypothetical protein
LKEPRAIGGIHGDELDTDAVAFPDAANDSAPADLTDRKIQQNLNERANRESFFRAHEETADRKAFDERDAALCADLPSRDNTPWRFDPRVFALFLLLCLASVHNSVKFEFGRGLFPADAA